MALHCLFSYNNTIGERARVRDSYITDKVNSVYHHVSRSFRNKKIRPLNLTDFTRRILFYFSSSMSSSCNGSSEMTSCSAPQVGQMRMSPSSGISSSVGIGELHSWQDDII